MSVSGQVNETATILSLQFPSAYTVTAAGADIKSPVGGVAPAKVGALTTRTNDTDGELTMAADHGITTGARLDLYWTTGSRRGITVGTVATNQVPISGGAGDVLPADETDITAMVPIEEEILLTGDDVSLLAFYSNVYGTIVLADAMDAEIMAVLTGASLGGQQSYIWNALRDTDNPVAGEDVAKAFFSHGSSTETADMRVAALYD